MPAIAPPNLRLKWPCPPPVCSAGFQTCRIAGFQACEPSEAPADLEDGETAGLETCATLNAGSEVHVWALALNVPPQIVEALPSLLSPAELQRAARFHFEVDRHRFIVAHAGMRLLLGHYLQQPPASIQFSYGPQGKPALAAGSEPGLEFNLTHSANLALVAVTRGASIGVDLEHLTLVPDADALVARFFCPREQVAFKRLSASQRTLAFFNLWTRKEAWLKATGEGIGHLLGQVEVSFLPGQPAQLLSLPHLEQRGGPRPGAPASLPANGQPRKHAGTDADPSCQAAAWSLYALEPAPGFVGAVALAAPTARLRCWSWPELLWLEATLT